MARNAALIVESVVVAACVLMRGVAGGAAQFARTEAAAHGQAVGLESHVLDRIRRSREAEAMTGAAELDLRRGAEFTGINRMMRRGIGQVRFGSGMAALALHAGHDRLEIARHRCGMAAEALGQHLARLQASEGGLRTR